MCTVVERPIPGYTNYFARDDGTIRTPHDHILTGHSSVTCQHLRVAVKKPYWRKWYYKLVHRLVASAFVHNPRPDLFHVVDHINRDPTDNRPCNLRWLTQQLNTLNNDALGCTFHKRYKKWWARVKVLGKSHSIGYYKPSYLAHRAAKAFREQALNRIYLKYIDEAQTAGKYFFWKPETTT